MFNLNFTICHNKESTTSVFNIRAIGSGTYRDKWVSGFSKKSVISNTDKMICAYNNLLQKGRIIRNDKLIKWTAKLEQRFNKKEAISLDPSSVRREMYRPFTKKWVFYDSQVVERPGLFAKIWGTQNITINTTGRSTSKGFSALVSNVIPDRNLMSGGAQSFMLYNHENSDELIHFDEFNIAEKFSKYIGLSPKETFAYVYALLNSKEYQQKYSSDLKKDLARIPIAQNKKKYVEVGKKLIDLHLNYEKVPLYSGVNIITNGPIHYAVEKMKFDKRRNPNTHKLEKDRTTIIFNNSIKITEIPERAYKYVVNGKSAIEWIMEQYYIDKDDNTGLVDDPNNYSDDPKYIFNLLLRIINVSVQTVDLIGQLPKFEVDESYYKDKG